MKRAGIGLPEFNWKQMLRDQGRHQSRTAGMSAGSKAVTQGGACQIRRVRYRPIADIATRERCGGQAQRNFAAKRISRFTPRRLVYARCPSMRLNRLK